MVGIELFYDFRKLSKGGEAKLELGWGWSDRSFWDVCILWQWHPLIVGVFRLKIGLQWRSSQVWTRLAREDQQ